ncbi:porin family protein [Flavobacterium sp.]|uniref:porin family protein n=1 Tax=Flavobacterium sp. TaxID=239 RepID=UPI00286A77DB|nr:porin family protein [Flavobacterium sp.]
MKNVIYSLGLILFVFNFSNAQLIKIGIKAGGNYSNFESSTFQTKAIASYHLGLVSEIKLSKALSLQPEFLYSTQGASYKNLVQEYKSELGYMSVPILAKLYLGKVLSIEAGPQFSYLLSKKVDASTNINEFDFAMASGLGIKLTENIFLQGRYTFGITKVDKNLDFKNAVGQLSVGYFF